jgi:phospholipid transport system substrate-binding protein
MVYAPKFKGWSGTFKTTKSSQIKNNLYLVEMKLINSKDSPSLKLDWRMYLNSKNEFKILDVNIDGVSMLVTQRAEFISVIKNSPDGVMGLIKKMKIKTNS